MKRKLISILLSLAMVFTMMPFLGGVAYGLEATAVTLTLSNGTTKMLTGDASGTGYSYKASTQTLTLNNWIGRGITANGDFTIKLVGTNTINMTEEEGRGITNDAGYTYVKADSTATLNVKASDFTSGGWVYGIYGRLVLQGNVNLNVEMTNMEVGSNLIGISDLIYAGNNNKVNIKVEGDTWYVEGIGRDLILAEDDPTYNTPTNMTGNSLIINAKNTATEDEYISSKYCVGVMDMELDDAGIDMTVNAIFEAGQADNIIAINYISELTGFKSGSIKATGLVCVGRDNLPYLDGSFKSNKPANDNYWWTKFWGLGSWVNCMTDVSGNYITDVELVPTTPGSQTPKWTAGNNLDISGKKVGDFVEVILIRGLRGMSSYSSNDMSFEVVGGTLPAGMETSWHGVRGTLEAPSAAGHVVVRCTDKLSNKYVDVTINYAEIVEPDRYATIGGTTFEIKESKSGEGWSWDPATKTLSLNEYDAGPIIVDSTINIKLTGTNFIQANNEGDDKVGLDLGYGSVISADSEATLRIYNSSATLGRSVKGIKRSIVLKGNVNLIIALSVGASGIRLDGADDITFEGSNNKVDIKLVSCAEMVQGAYHVDAQRSDTEPEMTGNSITVKAVTSDSEQGLAYGIERLTIVNTGLDITVDAQNNKGSQERRIAIGKIYAINHYTYGKIKVINGITRIPRDNLAYFDNSFKSTTPKDDQYVLKFIDNSFYSIYFADLEGKLLEQLELVPNTEETTPKWLGGSNCDIPVLVRGDYFRCELTEYIRGLTTYNSSNLRFEVTSGTLPEGLYLGNDGCIGGYVETTCPAGKVTVRCTDLITNKTLDIPLSYGGVYNGKPVTSITLSQYSWVPDGENEITVTAQVNPSDATNPTLNVYSQKGNVQILDQSEPDSEGRTTFKLRAWGTGTDTITVESMDTHVKQTISVLLKEPLPEAEINFPSEKLTNLVAGGTYVISMYDVEGVECVADENGEIPIKEEWIDNTIYIQKKGEGGTSEIQYLTVPDRREAPVIIDTEKASNRLTEDGKIKFSGTVSNGLIIENKETGESYYPSFGDVEVVVKPGTYMVYYGWTYGSFRGKINECTVGFLTCEDAGKEHIPGQWTTAKAPTCTQAGQKHIECTVCGKILETEGIPALGHVEGQWIVDKPATTEPGSKHLECAVCGETLKTQEIPAIVLKAPATAKATLTTKYSKTSGYDDVKFTWSKVNGASGYHVYYKKASAKTYTKLTSTKNLYAYKKNLADGVKYNFKVVPYVTVDGVNYTTTTGYKVANVYTLKRISTPKVTRSGSKVKVSWTNIPGESGYQISKATKKTATKIVTTYKTTKGNYKTLSATKGKTYYYKVRAYTVVGSTKIYGPWSYVKAFKR